MIDKLMAISIFSNIEQVLTSLHVGRHRKTHFYHISLVYPLMIYHFLPILTTCSSQKKRNCPYLQIYYFSFLGGTFSVEWNFVIFESFCKQYNCVLILIKLHFNLRLICNYGNMFYNVHIIFRNRISYKVISFGMIYNIAVCKVRAL